MAELVPEFLVEIVPSLNHKITICMYIYMYKYKNKSWESKQHLKLFQIPADKRGVSVSGRRLRERPLLSALGF